MAKIHGAPGAYTPALTSLSPELRAALREAVKVESGSPPDRLAYSVDELSAAGSVGRQLIYDAIGAGALRAKKCGDRTLILHKEAERWLSNLPDWTSRPRGRAAQKNHERRLESEIAQRAIGETDREVVLPSRRPRSRPAGAGKIGVEQGGRDDHSGAAEGAQ
jgi:hypothetical protein